MIDMSIKIKWCVIYGQHETRNFKSEQEALKAYPVIRSYSRTEYAESVVYRHPEWEQVKSENNHPG
jgi:hypothetical protein